MQEGILRFFSRISTPGLDTLAEGITMLGEQYLFIAVITLVFWNISKKAGLLLAFSYLTSALVNVGVKVLVQAPRPFEILADIEGKRVHTATGYSFPSGHTQGAAGFLTAAALLLRRFWFSCFAFILMLLIALSRVYLGVHWPLDVIAGLFLGVLSAWGTYRLLDPMLNDPPRLQSLLLRGIALIVTLTLALFVLEKTGTLDPVKIRDFYKLSGTAVGAMAGCILEMRLINFKTEANAIRKALRYLLGLAVALLLLAGLKALLPAGNCFAFLRYLAVSLWLIFLFPWAGVQSGLFYTAPLEKDP